MFSNRKIALITGANKGIGFEIARQLGHNDIVVYIGVRNEKLGAEAVEKLKSEGIDASFIKLDLNDFFSIDNAAKFLQEKHGLVDILINNAGIMSTEDSTVSMTDINVIKKTFETNFFGTFYVTQMMLPLLRKSYAARIVNISSGLGSLTLNQDTSWEHAEAKLIGYNSSKAALNMLTVNLAWELKNTKIKVNSANPNFTNTELLPDTSGGRPVQEGAKVAVNLALLSNDGPTGGFFEDNIDTLLPW